MKLKVQVHSENSKIKKDTDIYLVDTYGETKSFFKICKLVFLGKSFKNHGGQNPLEPVMFGCKILHGPNIENFTEVYKLLSKEKLSLKFNNSNQLTKFVSQSLSKKINFTKKVTKLKKIGSDILNNNLIEINSLL